METKDLLARVRTLEIKTHLLVEGLLQGAYTSVFKGRGMEFSEVREYSYGDDIRSIDWNVSARMDHPYVKEFVEERDLDVYLVLDASASNLFGSQKSKLDSALELACAILFSAIRNHDSVGLALFTNRIERFFSPRKGRKHAMRLVREMVGYVPKEKSTDLGASLRYLSKIARKRSVIFILSDFFSPDFLDSMRKLRSKHDVICVNFSDLREHELPDVGYIRLEDSETGEKMLVNTSDSHFRAQFTLLLRKRQEILRKQLARIRVDMITLRSDESYETPLRSFFRMRERRMVR